MTTQYLVDFSDWTGFTNSGFVQDSDPATTGDQSPDTTETLTLNPSLLTGIQFKNNDWNAYFRVRWGHNIVSGANQSRAYKLIITFNNGKTLEARWYSECCPTNATGLYGKYDATEQAAFTGSWPAKDQWHWVRLKTEVSGNDRVMKISFKTNGGTTKPDDGDFAGDTTIVTVTDGKIIYPTQIQIQSIDVNFGNIGETHLFDDVEIFSTADPHDASAVTGFDQVVEDNMESYYLRAATNGGGNAKLIVENPYQDIAEATIEAQLKKVIILTNSYDVSNWKGEVGTLSKKFDHVIYEAEEVTRKTMFTRVASDPTIYSTFLRYWEGRSVIDKDAFWQDKGVLDTHIISFAKDDAKIFATRPIAASITYTEDDFSTPYVPDNILGAGSRIYYPFDLVLLSVGGLDSDQALVVVDNDAAVPERWAAIFPNFIFEKYQNQIEASELYLEIAYVGKNDFSNSQDSGKPRVKIWDNTNSVWTEIDKISSSDVSGDIDSEIEKPGSPGIFYDRSNPVPFTYDIELELKDGEDDWDSGDTYAIGDRLIYNERLYSSLQNGNLNKIPTDEPTWWKLTIYDYLEVLDAASADDEFTKYQFKYLIQAGSHSFGISDEHNGFWLYESKLSFTFLNDNEPEYSTTSINTVNQTTINSDVASGFDLPEEDGFGVDDVLVVSKSAKDYIEDAWADSEISLIIGLDFDVTGADNFALTDDYTYQYFFDLLQDISSNLNATWWYDYPTDTIFVRSVDLLVDSGVIIQASDIMGYESGNWSIDIDATVERTDAIVVGDNVVVAAVFTPDDSFDLGDEVEIITDTSIQTPTQARNLLAAIQPLHEHARVTVRFNLDFKDLTKDFSDVLVGSLITVQWPTTGNPEVADYSGANKLMVQNLETNKNEETGYNEHVSVTAQLRES